MPEYLLGGYTNAYGGNWSLGRRMELPFLLFLAMLARKLEENSTWQTTAWCNEESYLNACRDAGIEHPVGMCFQDAGWKNGPWLGSGKNTKVIQFM